MTAGQFLLGEFSLPESVLFSIAEPFMRLRKHFENTNANLLVRLSRFLLRQKGNSIKYNHIGDKYSRCPMYNQNVKFLRTNNINN